MAKLKLKQDKITPCLWFDDNAEEAVKFYTTVFKKSKKGDITRYPENSPSPKGTVMTYTFSLEGQSFVALNAGPAFKFTEAISMTVYCKTQKEIDYYWEKLSQGGGKKVECGWVKDKFGLSWQIVPEILYDLIVGKDEARIARVMHAVWSMKKIEIKELKAAYKSPSKSNQKKLN